MSLPLKMKEFQTPQKDQSRSSKHKDSSSSSSSSVAASAKKPQKLPKKSLGGELASVAGDSLPEITPDFSQISKKSLNGALTSEVSLPSIASNSSQTSATISVSRLLSRSSLNFRLLLSQFAKKSLNDAFSAAEDSLSIITSDSSQTNTTISDLPALDPAVTSDAVLVDRSFGRPARSVYEIENLVRQVRSRKVLEEIIKVAVAEQLAAPPLISPSAEGIDRVLTYKLGIVLISFFVWCFAASFAVPFNFGYPAGPSPT